MPSMTAGVLAFADFFFPFFFPPFFFGGWKEIQDPFINSVNIAIMHGYL